MAYATNPEGWFLSQTNFEPVRTKWGWIVALGALFVIVGLLALASVMTATIASVFFIGAMMFIAGAAEIVNAFQMRTWGRFAVWLLLGALYVAAGLTIFRNPALAAAVFTLILGAVLIATGVVKILLALSVGHQNARFWVVVSGAISLLLGLIIVAHWPFSGLYVLGVFLGVDLVFAGFGWISVGLAAKQLTAAIAR